MVFDVDEAGFPAEVLERSRTMPVVVDFWASWCGPCRQLGPVLERAATAREGQVALAKLDTDANPGISRAFRIQGIPAVKAFRDAKVVDEFVGAQPPATVERFFDALLPSPADGLLAAGDEASLREALAAEPGRPDAVLALARLLLERGEPDEALVVLGSAPGSFQAQGLAARIRLSRDEASSDLQPALAALDAGDHAQGLDALLDALAPNGRTPETREDVRLSVVGALDELGPEHPLAKVYRRHLASALY